MITGNHGNGAPGGTSTPSTLAVAGVEGRLELATPHDWLFDRVGVPLGIDLTAP
jgi:hypothetical protein